MTYKDTMSFIEESQQYGSVLGLTTIRQLCKKLNNPQDRLQFVHIAGTNGKGSTLAFMSEILKESGLKTGRYSSPSVFCYEEKFQINGKTISKRDLCRIMEIIKEQAKKMQKEGFPHPTVFEMETALAFYYFFEQKCDLVVLETGLGGVEDATNIITSTLVSVITSISMDHKQILGDSLKEIAQKKAGIIKNNIPTVTISQDKDAAEVIARVCKEKKSSLVVADKEDASDIIYDIDCQKFSYHELKDISITLAGSYQIENAVLAIETVNVLKKAGIPITEKALRKGLFRAKWPGRFTCINKEPLFIIDGAHNENAAVQLRKSVETYFQGKNLILIMGVLADKEYEKICKIMAPLAQHIITITPPVHDRALRSFDLASKVIEYNDNVTAADSIKDAVDMALLLSGKEDVILAFGSLSYLNKVKETLST